MYLYILLYLVDSLGNKKVTTMRIDEELLRKALDLGLNVSKISENAIKEAIERMERKV